MKNRTTNSCICSIGDGGNDELMIRQADIGIGEKYKRGDCLYIYLMNN